MWLRLWCSNIDNLKKNLKFRHSSNIEHKFFESCATSEWIFQNLVTINSFFKILSFRTHSNVLRRVLECSLWFEILQILVTIHRFLVNFTLCKNFFVLLGSKLTDLHIEKYNSVFAASRSGPDLHNSTCRINAEDFTCKHFVRSYEKEHDGCTTWGDYYTAGAQTEER